MKTPQDIVFKINPIPQMIGTTNFKLVEPNLLAMPTIAGTI
jgi:hypothetical protein